MTIVGLATSISGRQPRTTFLEFNSAARKLRKKFKIWQQTHAALDDRMVDRMLGLRETATEHRIDEVKLMLRFGNERFTYGGTSYTMARQLIRTLSPRNYDVFYDLGAGYGRILLYGALTSSAMFRGIEIVPQRVNEVTRAQKRLQLPNIEIRQGNVEEIDFSDGTIFFLYDPFFRDVLRGVGARLREIARRRMIRIASLAGSNDYFLAQTWLREVASPYVVRRPGCRYGLLFFESERIGKQTQRRRRL
jgi:hypothetical protein